MLIFSFLRWFTGDYRASTLALALEPESFMGFRNVRSRRRKTRIRQPGLIKGGPRGLDREEPSSNIDTPGRLPTREVDGIAVSAFTTRGVETDESKRDSSPTPLRGSDRPGLKTQIFPKLIVCVHAATDHLVRQNTHSNMGDATRRQTLDTIQPFNPKTSGNIAHAFFLKAACPDSHLSTQRLQTSGLMHSSSSPKPS